MKFGILGLAVAAAIVNLPFSIAECHRLSLGLYTESDCEPRSKVSSAASIRGWSCRPITTNNPGRSVSFRARPNFSVDIYENVDCTCNNIITYPRSIQPGGLGTNDGTTHCLNIDDPKGWAVYNAGC
jgi:hypothetical protein